MKKRIGIEKILLGIGISMLLIAGGYTLYQRQLTSQHIKKVEQLRERIEQESNQIEEQGTYRSPYQYAFEENPDCIGWLIIPGTKVDYPVMQTKQDESYYLYRDYEKQDDKNGSLILAAAADIKKPSTNLLIHGHNMKSGEMFGELDLYKDASYEKEHDTILLYTEQYEVQYEILAVFYGKVLGQEEEGFRYYHFFDATNEEEFINYYDNIKKLSLYDTGITASYGDELITLSTCSNVGKEGRFVVVGKKIN